MLFLLLCCGCELHVTAGLFVVVVAVDIGFFFFFLVGLLSIRHSCTLDTEVLLFLFGRINNFGGLASIPPSSLIFFSFFFLMWSFFFFPV